MRRFLKGAYDWVGRTLSLTGDAEPWLQLFGNGTYAGKSVDATSAMQISTVWSCVRGIAETCATLPVGVYEKDGKGNAKEVDHPLAEVLKYSPNADMTGVEYIEAGVANVAREGNGYSLLDRNVTGNVSSLYPVLPASMQPRRNRDTNEIEYRYNDRGRWETLPREKVWHVKGFGADGLMGYSPIGYMRQALGVALATEELSARFFSQGAKPGMILSLPQVLTKEQRGMLREGLAEKYEGLGNMHKLMVVEGGATVTPAMMNLDDAQFLLLRGFTVDEICRIFRYPPHMVAKMERATFTNIEQQAIEFAVYCLRPYLVRLEKSAERWLLKPAERGRFFLRFNFEALLRGDAEARAKFYAAMLQNGVYNRNEVRALENRNRVEGAGMDDYTVQQNMIDVNQLAELLAAKISSGKTPAEPAKLRAVA